MHSASDKHSLAFARYALSAAIGTFSSQFPRDLMNSRDIYFVPQRLEQLGNALRTSTTPSRSPPPASRCTRQETRRTGIAARHASGAAPRQRACAAIRALCEQAGFVRGGARTGDGLFVDCIAPIIQQTPQPPRASRPLPKIDPQLVADCKAQKSELRPA
jgi:hypothetical protein